MHSRIILVICFSLLAGFATSSQTNANKLYPTDEIDIDSLEGSGANRELIHDLEASGSGLGPDDEDLTPDNIGPVQPKQPPPNPLPTTKAPVDEPGVGVGGGVYDTGVGVGTGTNGGTHTSGHGVPNQDVIMNPKNDDRPTSFFAQPGILAAVIGGAVVGLLCAILVVMFIVYRMRKKDEGSYALDEPKRSPTSNSYTRGGTNKEFYA